MPAVLCIYLLPLLLLISRTYTTPPAPAATCCHCACLHHLPAAPAAALHMPAAA
ncbi:hypothetical protein TNCV_631141, partial [Trichonephila clavipes]